MTKVGSKATTKTKEMPVIEPGEEDMFIDEKYMQMREIFRTLRRTHELDY